MLVIHALGYGGAGKMIVKLADDLAQRDDLEVVLYVEECEGKHYPMDERVKVYQEKEFFENYYTRHFQQIFQFPLQFQPQLFQYHDEVPLGSFLLQLIYSLHSKYYK